MNIQDAEEFTQALGLVMAGGYRIIIQAKKLGVPQALGLTVEEWVQTRLGGYVRMSVPYRREVVKELAAEGMTQREIGEVLGMSQPTVGRDLDANGSTNDGQRKAKSDSNASKPKQKILTQAEREQFEKEEGKRRARQLTTEWICGLGVFDPGPLDPVIRAEEMLEDLDYKVARIATDLSAERYQKIARVITAIAKGLKNE